MTDPAVTRREFVKTSTAAAAALPFLGTSLAVARTAHVAGSDTLKVGLIGCGGRGTGAATQAMIADKGAVLWAMGDTFGDRIESSFKELTNAVNEPGDDSDPNARRCRPEQLQVSAERRFTGFDAYQKVIDSGVDVVLLTSYPCFRPAHLKAAVAAGKHVFAEKPVSVDGPGTRSVLESAEIAKQKNLSLLVGFCWRYHTGMRAMFDKVHAGGIGEVASVHTTYHTGTLGKRPRKPEWSDLEFQMRNWWHFTWISGDHVVEQAIHSVDRMAWAMNDKLPTRVTCLGGRAARSGPEHGNVFDHFSAIYEYDDGRRAFHSCRQIDGCPNDNTDYVEGTTGRAIVNGWTPVFQIKDRKNTKTWEHTGKPEDAALMYQNEHDELFAAIRSGKPVNDCVRGTHSTLMAIMARMAAYTGQTVTWEQALNSKESLVPETLAFGPMETPPVAVPGVTKMK